MSVYRAQTRIKHGEADSVIWFEPGEVVTGLDKDDMAALWDAGALYESDNDDDSQETAQEKKDAAEGTQPPQENQGEQQVVIPGDVKTITNETPGSTGAEDKSSSSTSSSSSSSTSKKSSK
jgi:hypothetical protein